MTVLGVQYGIIEMASPVPFTAFVLMLLRSSVVAEDNGWTVSVFEVLEVTLAYIPSFVPVAIKTAYVLLCVPETYTNWLAVHPGVPAKADDVPRDRLNDSLISGRPRQRRPNDGIRICRNCDRNKPHGVRGGGGALGHSEPGGCQHQHCKNRGFFHNKILSGVMRESYSL